MGFLSDVTGTGAAKVYTPADIPPQTGKVMIVTGGHAGIGYATTEALVNAGATVYIASRSKDKVDKAIEELTASDAGLKDRLKFLEMDLSELRSVKAAVDSYLSLEERLDVVVCNAGVMATPYNLTADGVEEQFQVNHLSHFLFVTRLLPLMEKTGEKNGHPSRVVMLSSFAHNFISWAPFASPKFDSLESVNRTFEPAGRYVRYSHAKLSNILFARELNRKASHVRSIPVHPGFVASGLYQHQPGMTLYVNNFIPVADGALSSLYAATSSEVEEKNLWGSYLVPHAIVKQTTAYGNSEKLAGDLWVLSEALIQERVPN